MELGTVVFFNNETGFGVIQNDEGKKLFLHYSEIRSGSKSLFEGQRVCFDVRKGLSDKMALNIRMR
ncbi:MAG: cold-shock protein [Deltaproteobacteria bacterium]|nr:cold-shock protein [Deltaproteobacteria bacterium]